MNKKLFLGLLAAAMIFIIGCETTGQGPGGIAFKKPGSQPIAQRCFSDNDCRNTICPQVVGQDTPYCNVKGPNNKMCACGPGKMPVSTGQSGSGDSSGSMMGDGSASSGLATGSMAGSGSCKRICLTDMKKCPDGSLVGRDSCNNCQFEPCPTPREPGTTPPTSCPKDLRQCADGSFVARNYDKKCEFFPCPSASDTTTQRFHPSDTNEDWRINLAEMTRFASLAVKAKDIYQGWQFYTWDSEARDGIGDWVGTAGYNAPIDNRYTNAFHPADTNKDWRLELGETTRFIALVLKTKDLWLGGENYKWDSAAQTWVNVD